MNSIAVILAVGLCFAVGQALECYKCPLGLWDVCITTKTTCKSGELCYNGVGGVGSMKIKMKGCIEVAKCNQTESTVFNNITISDMTKTCCNTDLCNMAPGLPRASGLNLAAVIIFPLLVASLMA